MFDLSFVGELSFASYRPSSARSCCPDLDFRELLSRLVFHRKVWRHARMKNADWPRLRLKNESSESEIAARTHSQYSKNDRSGIVRLSKIAHKSKTRVSCRRGSNLGFSAQDEG